MKSPYYTQSHVQFRQALRIWLDENIRPQAETIEKSGKLSKKFLKKCCDVTKMSLEKTNISGKTLSNTGYKKTHP